MNHSPVTIPFCFYFALGHISEHPTRTSSKAKPYSVLHNLACKSENKRAHPLTPITLNYVTYPNCTLRATNDKFCFTTFSFEKHGEGLILSYEHLLHGRKLPITSIQI